MSAGPVDPDGRNLNAALFRNRPYNVPAGYREQVAMMRSTFHNWVSLGTLRKLAGVTQWQWLFDRPIVIRTRTGDTLYGRCQDLDGPIDVYGEGAYDINFLDWKVAKAVIDVGGHIGDFALWVASRSSCSIYAVEPNPETRAFFERNVVRAGLGSRIRVEPFALAARSGRARLGLAYLSSSSALGGSGIEVETLDLDGLIRRSGFAGVDLLKIDIEGGEYEVFEAAGKDSFEPVRAVFVETHPRDGGDRAMIGRRLREFGFTVAEEQFRNQGTFMAWR